MVRFFIQSVAKMMIDVKQATSESYSVLSSAMKAKIMRNLKSTFGFNLYLLLVFLFFSSSEANIIGEAACKIVDCGQGTCNSSVDKPPFFFECECYPGWTQLKILDLPVFPPCIIPNCSVNLNCSMPKLPPISLPTNLSDPCNFVWCGNGTCAPNGTGVGHKCNCDAGAFNLLKQPDMPCFQECYLGSDCNDLGIGPPPPPGTLPPPGTPNASGPSTTAAGSSSGGSRKWMGAIGYMAFLVSLQFVV